MAPPAKETGQTAQLIVAGLMDAGVDPVPCLDEIGLKLDEVTDLELRIETVKLNHLWALAVEKTQDPDFGVRCALLIQPGNYGVVEYAFRKSKNLREGALRLKRFAAILQDSGGYVFTDDGTNYVWEHVVGTVESYPRAAVDFYLHQPVRMIRNGTAKSIAPIDVYVDYPRPEDPSKVEALFATRIHYDSGRRALVYRTVDMEEPFADHEPGLLKVLDEHAAEVLNRLPRNDVFSDQVRRFIIDHLSAGQTDANAVADHLGMSVRTLTRRLADEGTSHKALLEEMRRELSERYLREATLSIREVTVMLGYSEPSAFHRAFKTWTGLTPARFREVST